MLNPASTITAAAGPKGFRGGRVPEAELALSVLVLVVAIIGRGAGAS
jgi:hypothetical protein